MARVYSWKIDNNHYAYLVPKDNKYIRGRVSGDELTSIGNTVKGWDKATYKKYYDAMNAEIKRDYGKGLSDNCDAYYDENIGETIIVLTGKDGTNGTNGLNGGDGSPGSDGSDGSGMSFEDFNNAIDEKLAAIREDINGQNALVEEYVNQKVNDTIRDAQERIDAAKKYMTELSQKLQEDIGNAASALDELRGLFDLSGDDIDAEDIINAINKTTEGSEWLKANSGFIETFKTDYDAAMGIAGGIGYGEDAKRGLMSWFGESLNVVSGTVGTVQRDMDASKGKIQDLASYYDTLSGTVSQVSSTLDAQNGVIEDLANFAKSGVTNHVRNAINAMSGTIISEATSMIGEDITVITDEINALDGKVETIITRQDGESKDLAQLGERMNAISGSMEQWITVANELSGTASDMREEWTQQSGILRTVTNLIADTDDNGKIVYYARNKNGEYIKMDYGPDENGIFVGDDGKEYHREEVSPFYKSAIGSYIQQMADSITLSVSDEEKSGLTAAIKLILSGDKAFINMVADEVNIDADMIVKAISAKTANIGGVNIGYGEIYADNSSGKCWKLDNNGKLYATDAEITGDITARSLTLKSGKSIEAELSSISGSVKAYADALFKNIDSGLSSTNVNELIENFINSNAFKTVLANGGYVTSETVKKWIEEAQLEGDYSAEELENLIKGLVSTEVSSVISCSQTSGGTKTTLNIGGKTYEWSTVDAGDFVIVGAAISGNNGSFIVDKYGLLQANNAIIKGEVYASEGEFIGTVKANSGEIGGMKISDNFISGNGFTVGSSGIEGNGFLLNKSGLTISGKIRQPFALLDPSMAGGAGAEEINKTKNTFADNLHASAATVVLCFPFDADQIGRRRVIVNNRGGRTQPVTGVSTIDAPDGYFFFEDGIAKKTLRFSNEIVELIGYGRGSTFYGYIVLSRKDIIDNARYGHDFKVLASGTLTAGGTIDNFVSFDGTSAREYDDNEWNSKERHYIMSSYNSSGATIRTPTTWFKTTSDLRIELTSRTPLYSFSYETTSNTNEFKIIGWKGTTYGRASCDFIIYNTNDWLTLGSAVETFIEKSTSSIYFGPYESGTSKKKTATITYSPNTASFRYDTTDTYGHGERAFNYSVDTTTKGKAILTVYPSSNNGSYQSEGFKITFTIDDMGIKKSVDIAIVQGGEDYNDPSIT